MKKSYAKIATSLGITMSMAISMIGCAAGNANTTAGPIESDMKTNVSEKPNIVYILLDDTGYADLGCYGSSIHTPNMDALAQNGIQYTNYYTTPLSSPSRAALLTGCEPNSVGMGTIADFDLGEVVPNFNGRIYPEHGTIASNLQENGYHTMAVGKWHLSPYDQLTPGGDTTYQPSGMGFDDYYIFTPGFTEQFNPGSLFSDGHFIEADTSETDYHFTEDMVRQATKYVEQNKEDGDDPFFLYFATGAMHAPLQAPEEYVDKYKGKFDHGWDKERELRFERQKELGLFAADETMHDRDPALPLWDDLNEEEKAVAARQMEIYAGFLEHTDAQIGQLIDMLKENGEYDNTIFVLTSDNGAAVSGGSYGSNHNLSLENAITMTLEDQYDTLDQLGNSEYGIGYSKGWTAASNTPFYLYKQSGFYGGTRVPLIVSGVDGLKEPGRTCDELVSVYDVTPTMLDLCGIEQAEELNGVKQHKMDGISFAKTLTDPNAVQEPRELFFMMNDTASYTDGGQYIIVRHPSTGWVMYDRYEDVTQCNDLSEKLPEEFEALRAKFEDARERYNAKNFIMDYVNGATKEELIETYGDNAKAAFGLLPEDAELTEEQKAYAETLEAFAYPLFEGRFGMASQLYKPSGSRLSANDYTYKKEDGIISCLSVAPMLCRSYDIAMDVTMNQATDQGVLLANGGIDGGFCLYVKDGYLNYEYRYMAENQKIVSSVPMPEGNSQVKVEYKKHTPFEGTITLMINGDSVAEQAINHYPLYNSFDYFSIGEDAGGKVSDAYGDNDNFTGVVDTVNIHLEEDTFQDN